MYADRAETEVQRGFAENDAVQDAGQVIKCAGWMPRHVSAMKDVASCDKPRSAASKRRPGDFRMGKPDGGHTPSPERELTQGTETSKYLEEKKSKEIP